MGKSNIRIRVDDDGRLEVIDPGYDMLPVMTAIDPDFEIRTTPLYGFKLSRFLKLRELGSGIEANLVAHESDEALWEVHKEMMESIREEIGISYQHYQHAGEASILDLKIELARRLISNCKLCGRRCGVNRLAGEKGICGLDESAFMAKHYTHIAEEAPINPSYLISVAGCGLRCRFCQQHELLDVNSFRDVPLNGSILSNIDFSRARTLSFIGGNPDESLYAILRLLAKASSSWQLPVVWNSNGYATQETIRLLEHMVDAYVPDFKFRDALCANNLAEAPDYPAVAELALHSMVDQDVPVIVRILVLPGHTECCHYSSIDYLSGLKAENLFVSIRGQYFPEWRISEADGDLVRRPTQDEVESVRVYATGAGLKLVD